MPNNTTSNDLECRSPQSHSTPKPPKSRKRYQKGYQQALTDFAIDELLEQLKSYSNRDFGSTSVILEEGEAEHLATVLVQALSANLNAQLFANYLKAIRHNGSEAFSNLSNLKLPLVAMSLPTQFPEVEIPKFLYGDRLRWISNGQATDWGIVIGRFYSFAPHSCRWCWCYLIWIDLDSPSSSWVTTDIAWEEDLEPFDGEAVL